LSDFSENTHISLNNVKLLVGGAGLPWNVRTYEKPAIDTLWQTEEKPFYTTIKGKTGETFSASPVLSLITGALCMKHNKIIGTGYDPLQTGLGNLAPQSALNHAFETGDITFVNSIHMGGNTVTVALQK
jgi:3-oxoacyl-[acyl-carrier-protein] synthase II